MTYEEDEAEDIGRDKNKFKSRTQSKIEDNRLVCYFETGIDSRIMIWFKERVFFNFFI